MIILPGNEPQQRTLGTLKYDIYEKALLNDPTASEAEVQIAQKLIEELKTTGEVIARVYLYGLQKIYVLPLKQFPNSEIIREVIRPIINKYNKFYIIAGLTKKATARDPRSDENKDIDREQFWMNTYVINLSQVIHRKTELLIGSENVGLLIPEVTISGERKISSAFQELWEAEQDGQGTEDNQIEAVDEGEL